MRLRGASGRCWICRGGVCLEARGLIFHGAQNWSPPAYITMIYRPHLALQHSFALRRYLLFFLFLFFFSPPFSSHFSTYLFFVCCCFFFFFSSTVFYNRLRFFTSAIFTSLCSLYSRNLLFSIVSEGKRLLYTALLLSPTTIFYALEEKILKLIKFYIPFQHSI